MKGSIWTEDLQANSLQSSPCIIFMYSLNNVKKVKYMSNTISHLTGKIAPPTAYFMNYLPMIAFYQWMETGEIRFSFFRLMKIRFLFSKKVYGIVTSVIHCHATAAIQTLAFVLYHCYCCCCTAFTYLHYLQYTCIATTYP